MEIEMDHKTYVIEQTRAVPVALMMGVGWP